jgi:sulfite exporter TauE/SafE
MSSIDNLYWVLLSSGFLIGFGHCIGMCGPIVVSLSLNLKGKPTLLPHLLYNSGRITTYSILGGIMGLTGSFTIVASNIAHIQKGVMILTGLMIVFMGLVMSGFIRFDRLFSDDCNTKGIISSGFRKLSASNSILTYFPLGLLLGLLPCGPVYTALLSTARAGMESASPLEGFFTGMGLMLAFGVGTVPALLLMGKLTDLKWLKSREIIYKIGSGLMVIVGIYFVIKGIQY